MNVLKGDVEELHLKSIIAFDGTTIGGLRIHPDGIHLIYPMGNKVTLYNQKENKQYFLDGHTNIISAIDVSSTGKYIASGQINYIGFKALVIIWNFTKRKIFSKHEVHKVRVESVAFSRDDKYLISLGGRDCSSIIVWDLERNKPLCGTQASKGTQGEATALCVTHKRGTNFVTGGEGTLSVWKIDYEARKLCGIDVNVAKLKRTVLCMVMDSKDEILYCGTSTGDVMKIRLNYHHNPEILEPVQKPIMIACFARLNPKKTKPIERVELYSMGVRAIKILDKDLLLIGAGNGIINIVKETKDVIKSSNVKLFTTPNLVVLKSANARSMITSFNIKDKDTVLVATVACEIISLDLNTFEIRLRTTCHTSTIYDIAFPHDFSDVFATASKNNVRVWNMETMQELLRISVPNFSCSSVIFSYDGKSILTGWDDGIVRSFTPLTGRLIYSILNAHNKGVSAIVITHDDKMLITGGSEGQVRAWNVASPHKQQLICTLKEHKGPVSAIHINKFSDEAVSASTDGTCIIWDLIRKCRKQILFANTLFMCVKYYPSGVQILTGGSDRKIAYWEVFDGSLIRELEGSTSAGINTLDISPDGNMFITGGNDQMVKLWKYQEGITTHIGYGHSAVVTALRFSPNGKKIVSTSASGSIFVWDCPYDVSVKSDKEEETGKGDKPASKVKGKKTVGIKENKVEENVSDLCTDRCGSLQKTKSQGDVIVDCVCNDKEIKQAKPQKIDVMDDCVCNDKDTIQKIKSQDEDDDCVCSETKSSEDDDSDCEC